MLSSVVVVAACMHACFSLMKNWTIVGHRHHHHATTFFASHSPVDELCVCVCVHASSGYMHALTLGASWQDYPTEWKQQGEPMMTELVLAISRLKPRAVTVENGTENGHGPESVPCRVIVYSSRDMHTQKRECVMGRRQRSNFREQVQCFLFSIHIVIVNESNSSLQKRA